MCELARAWYALVQVYANDLNPVSYQYLQENVRINKVLPATCMLRHGWHVTYIPASVLPYGLSKMWCCGMQMSKRVSIHNMDGRKFIRDLSAGSYR